MSSQDLKNLVQKLKARDWTNLVKNGSLYVSGANDHVYQILAEPSAIAEFKSQKSLKDFAKKLKIKQASKSDLEKYAS